MGVIIAIVGMTGSGKSVLADVFEGAGFSKIRFGQITMDILNEQGLIVNEKNERQVRESLRHEFGMAAYAIKNIPKIKALQKKTDKIILDGLYSWEEYLVLKEEFPEMIVAAVYVSPKKRYSRLNTRKERPLTDEEAFSRDKAEIENLHKAGPIAMADYAVMNEGSVEELEEKAKKLLELIIND
ncbi:MAG: AAA family ATPase [Nanoarchaeota archaeon]|nr:AAA family ATPase [Nanoarchaeota archaeon]